MYYLLSSSSVWSHTYPNNALCISFLLRMLYWCTSSHKKWFGGHRKHPKIFWVGDLIWRRETCVSKTFRVLYHICGHGWLLFWRVEIGPWSNSYNNIRKKVCAYIYTHAHAHTKKMEVQLTFYQHPLNHFTQDTWCTLGVSISDLKECGSAIVLVVWDLSRKIKIGGIRGIMQGYYKYLSVVGR